LIRGAVLVGGLYRYVRNPIYLAGLAVIVGQGLLLSRAVLSIHAAAVALAFVGLFYGYEEPSLRRRYGEEYEAYRQAVPAWWPAKRRSASYRPGERGWIKVKNRAYWRYGEEIESLRRSIERR
jgi:hypothetical protein